MRSGRSGFYRRQDGTERLWFSQSDIERMMEDALRKGGVFPTDQRPVVDVERFIASLGVRMDQHAELEPTVLGLTEFYANASPKILINRDLTGAIDDDDTPPGIRGRWRATIAHEGSHVVMHRVLFEVCQDQDSLFRMEERAESQRLMRCFKKNVLFRGGGSDWREIQANMGMAALLMPRGLFRDLAGQAVARLGLSTESLGVGSAGTATLAAAMAALFDVSKQAAGIRLETLEMSSPVGQQPLIQVAR